MNAETEAPDRRARRQTRGNESASHVGRANSCGHPFPIYCVIFCPFPGLNNRMEMVRFIFFIILLHLEKNSKGLSLVLASRPAVESHS